MIEAINFCQKSGILKATYIIKMVLNIIFVLVPVILIITSMISLIKNLTGNDTNTMEIIKPIITRIFVGIFIFFVPIFFKVILSLSNKDFINNTYLSCITNSTKEKIAYYEGIEKQEAEAKKKENEAKRKEATRKQKEKDNAKKKNNTINGNSNSSTSSGRGNSSNMIYFVGDSRTVGMYNIIYNASYPTNVNQVQGNEYWLGAGAQGLSWFSNTALPILNSRLSSQNANVTIQLGTNDLYNTNAPNSYVNYVKNLAIKYPNSYFVLVSVNPIEDNVAARYNYSVRNSDAIAFNTRYQNAINSAGVSNMRYCDVYNVLAGHSGITGDGIHYKADAYRTIYQAIKSCI